MFAQRPAQGSQAGLLRSAFLLGEWMMINNTQTSFWIAVRFGSRVSSSFNGHRATQNLSNHRSEIALS